jgi:2-polyprenyl-6-methoxyphenol hydroxylase-like FAD-dependent oxidoreductase
MDRSLRVLIVGGGIGGLSLANMFERAGVEYIILEKATRIRALGSSLGLDASSLPVMEQLGLLEDFYHASKAVRQFNFYNETLKSIGTVDFSDLEEM